MINKCKFGFLSKVTFLFLTCNISFNSAFAEKNEIKKYEKLKKYVNKVKYLNKKSRPVKSKANTLFHGIQNIVTEKSRLNKFILRDTTRGKGIRTIVSSRPDGKVLSNNSRFWNVETIDRKALDAHYVTQSFYDIMLKDFNWDGIDNEGGLLRVDVGSGNGVTGSWNATGIVVGDGDCSYGPSVTADIIAHEFMHGIVEHTSGLGVRAINESIADMMGQYIEYKMDKGNFSWEVANSSNPSLPPARIMDDPNRVGMPSYFEGKYWNDSGSVHHRGGVASFWFTLISDGQIGVNEIGVDYSVPRIGIEKAAQVIFLANREYLTRGTYSDFYKSTVLAAEELFGLGSTEVFAVREAWRAVALPTAQDVEGVDLSIQNGVRLSENFVCGIDTFHPIDIRVTNFGTKAYTPDMNASFVLNSSLPIDNREVLITDTIPAGKSVTYTINEWLISASLGKEEVEATLNFPEDIDDSNHTYQNDYTFKSTSPDLSLTSQLGPFVPRINTAGMCGSDRYSLAFEIRNNSCATIRKGTKLNLQLADNQGNIVYQKKYRVPHKVQAFGSIIETLPVNMKNVDSGTLHFLANYNRDSDTTNNSVEIDFERRYTIIENYINTFDDEPETDKFLRTLTNSSNGETVKLNNETYYLAIGNAEQYGDFFDGVTIPCTDIDNAYRYIAAPGDEYSASLAFCVDARKMKKPMLSFDMVQFRNNIRDDDPRSSVLFLSWSGTHNHNETIMGQVEGESVHYQRELPPGFVGEVTLKTYTEIGDEFFIFLPDIILPEEQDLILLDNLQIQTNGRVR